MSDSNTNVSTQKALILTSGALTSALNMGGYQINFLAPPSVSTDAATKGYVDSAIGGTGTVTTVSVVSSNGLAGTVANPTTTPAITLSTTVTGILYGNGTAVAAAIAANFPTLNQNTTGTAANITATSNSTLTTLSALSLLGSQVTGNISGNAANVTGTVAIANGGTGSGSAPTQYGVVYASSTTVLASTTAGSSGQVLTSNATSAPTFQSPFVSSIGAFGSSPNANGLSVAAGVLTLQPASNTQPGAMSTGTQSILGSKTFLSPMTASNGITTFGNITLSNAVNYSIFSMNGTATLPVYTFTASTGTGIYSPAANQLGFTSNGVAAGYFDASQNLNLTHALSIANGGTGQTTASAAFTALSPLTTSGDLIYENATPAPARLAIGSTGQILTVVAGLPAWASPATSGTVTSVSVVSANGLAGTVATATTTPAITLSTTVTGILYGNGTSIAAAVAGNFPTLNQNTTGTAANVTATSNSTLTTLSALSLLGSQVTGNISGNASGFTGSLSGDVTGTQGATVLSATTNGTLTSLTALTSASNLATVGTITSGTWNATTIAIAHGGTGQITAAAAYNALSPMTTTGDLEYESGTNTAARLAIGSTGQVLTVVAGLPAWSTPSGTPVSQTPNQSNAAGSGTSLALANHVHNIPTGAASTISSNANAQGSAAAFAQQDHTHQITASSAALDQLPQYDGSNWQSVYPEVIENPSRMWDLHEEFLSNNSGSTIIGELVWSIVTSGGASTVASNTAQLDNNHPGVIRITAGGLGGNAAAIQLNSTNIIVLGGGAFYSEWLVQIVTLSSGGNTYTVRIGLGDATAADFTNGVYFEYTSGTSVNWLIKTASGGTRTSTTTSTAVSAGTWAKLGILVNAAASSVTYTINGTSVGTITTNIPTTATGLVAHQTRTAGTPVGFDIDYVHIYQRFTTAR